MEGKDGAWDACCARGTQCRDAVVDVERAVGCRLRGGSDGKEIWPEIVVGGSSIWCIIGGSCGWEAVFPTRLWPGCLCLLGGLFEVGWVCE